MLPPWAWGGVKALAVAAVMLILGAFVPRIKEEHLLAWCWKLGIPLALFNILLVGVLLITVGG